MSLSRRRVVALVAKDARIHGREIALTQAGILLLVALMTYAKPGEIVSLASAVFSFNLLLAGFWGEWLITREKTKGTFAWIRSCPVDDADLVVAKFLAVGLCLISLWSLSSLIFLRDYLVLTRPGVWVALQAALLAFGMLSAATRFRFGPKAGQLVPFGCVLAVLGAIGLLEQAGYLGDGDPGALLRTFAGQVSVAAVAIAGAVTMVVMTLNWVRRSDTERLLE